MKRGDRILFDGNKKTFLVRECNDRFAICTQSYNFRKGVVVYTIIDFEKGIRGTDNMIFGIHDYYSDDDCKDAFDELNKGELEVSYRNRVKLEIKEIKEG